MLGKQPFRGPIQNFGRMSTLFFPPFLNYIEFFCFCFFWRGGGGGRGPPSIPHPSRPLDPPLPFQTTDTVNHSRGRDFTSPVFYVSCSSFSHTSKFRVVPFSSTIVIVPSISVIIKYVSSKGYVYKGYELLYSRTFSIARGNFNRLSLAIFTYFYHA